MFGKTINLRKVTGVAVAAATLLALAPLGVAAHADPSGDETSGTDFTVSQSSNETITITPPTDNTAAITGHNFAAVRIGSYTSASKVTGSTDTLKTVAVGNNNIDANVTSAATDALKQAKVDTGIDADAATPAAGYDGNPAGEVSALNANQGSKPFDSALDGNANAGATLRYFVSEIVKDNGTNASAAFRGMFKGDDAITATPDENTGKVKFTVAPGMYIVRDMTASSNGTSNSQSDRNSIPMLVETAVGDGTNTYNKIGTSTLGEVNMKIDDPYKLTKVLSQIDGKDYTGAETAQVGSVLTYTLKTAMPLTTGYDHFRFVVTDKPGAAGLTFMPNTSTDTNVTVKIGSGSSAVDADDVNITSAARTSDEGDENTGYVAFDLSKTVMDKGTVTNPDATTSNPGNRRYAPDADITITYKMKVNQNARNGQLSNAAKVAYSSDSDTSAQPADDGPATLVTDPTNPNFGGVDTTATANGATSSVDANGGTGGANGNGSVPVYFRHFYLQTTDIANKDDSDYTSSNDQIAGAKFTVYAGDSATGNPIKFVQRDGAGSGAYIRADSSASNTVTELDVSKDPTSGLGGVLTVDGLSAGDYTVVQSQATTGYQGSVLPTFTVTLAGSGPDTTVKNSSEFWSLVQKTGDTPLHTDTVTSETNEDTGVVTTTITPLTYIHVYNAKSLSQLPLTGGAGIILGVFLAAVLIAIAGGLYVFKRREAGRAVTGTAQIMR